MSDQNFETIEPAEKQIESMGLVPVETDAPGKEIQALVGSEKFMRTMAALKDAKPGASITGGYKEFTKPGETVRCVYAGLTMNHKFEIDPQTKMQVRRDFQGARFVSEDGVWINSGKTLVDAVSTIQPGTPVEITFVGEKDNKNGPGKTKIFNVRVLEIEGNSSGGPRTMGLETIAKAQAFVDGFIVNSDGKVYTKDGVAISPKEKNQILGGLNRIVAELFAVGYAEKATSITADMNSDASRLAGIKSGIQTLKEHFETENEIPF
jgi:hypothetical protein